MSSHSTVYAFKGTAIWHKLQNWKICMTFELAHFPTLDKIYSPLSACHLFYEFPFCFVIKPLDSLSHASRKGSHAHIVKWLDFLHLSVFTKMFDVLLSSSSWHTACVRYMVIWLDLRSLKARDFHQLKQSQSLWSQITIFTIVLTWVISDATITSIPSYIRVSKINLDKS